MLMYHKPVVVVSLEDVDRMWSSFVQITLAVLTHTQQVFQLEGLDIPHLVDRHVCESIDVPATVAIVYLSERSGTSRSPCLVRLVPNLIHEATVRPFGNKVRMHFLGMVRLLIW